MFIYKGSARCRSFLIQNINLIILKFMWVLILGGILLYLLLGLFCACGESSLTGKRIMKRVILFWPVYVLIRITKESMTRAEAK